MSIATKLSRMLTYLNRFLYIKSQDPLITWSYEITITVVMITKLGRMVTYLERPLIIQLLTFWSRGLVNHVTN